MSSSTRKAKAPAKRDSGTQPVAPGVQASSASAPRPAPLDRSLCDLISRALGSDGVVSMSAGACEAMANELHAMTFKLASLEELHKVGRLHESDIDDFGQQIADIAHRAQAVAELERELAARAREGGA